MTPGRVIGALIVALLAAGAASAAGRPDLVETGVSVSQSGTSLRVRDAIRNAGTAVAPSSRASYFLDTRRVGGRTVRRLRPQATSHGSKTLTIPRFISPGSYRLRVCADGRSGIRESSERNNCRAAVQSIRVGDRTPPTFAGLVQATTCIPGPIGVGRSSSYYLKWRPARDGVTRSSRIEYDIYQANTPKSEDFATPTYTTTAGATSFTTPLLPTDTSYYFVVRARDRAGNSDTNTIERMGVNLCL